jgi:hypothetical protein
MVEALAEPEPGAVPSSGSGDLDCFKVIMLNLESYIDPK